MSKRKPLFTNVLLYSLLVLLSLLYLLLGLHDPVNVYDEGITVYGAHQVANGELPYRNFWTLYAPGQFYVLSGLFKLFGTSIIVERLYDIFLKSLISLVVFLIARRVASRGVSLLSWFISVLWMADFGFYGYTVFPALLLGLSSVFLLIEFSSRPKPILLIGSGILVGMATLFRHDVGLYVLIAGTSWLILLALFQDEGNQTWKSKNPLKMVLFFCLGVFVIVVPTALYFASHVPLRELWYDLIVFPTTVFPSFRSLPYPTPPNPIALVTGEVSLWSYVRSAVEIIPFYVPLAVYGLGILMITAHIRESRLRGKRGWTILFLVIVGLISFNQARVRSDLIHLLPTFIPAVIVAPILIYEHFNRKREPVHLAAGIAMVFLCVSLLPKPIYSGVRDAYEAAFLQPDMSHEIERARYVHVHPDQANAVDYIRRFVPREEAIYVGSSTHDKIFINDVMFYFLADRSSATKYHELHPGLATTSSIQRQIIKDLGQNDVRYVVLVSAFEDKREPNQSGVSSGVVLLDAFIRSNYSLVQEFGDYTIWRKASGR